MKSLFEEMGGTYRREGDYLIPNIIPPECGDEPLGKYGRLRRTFLQEHREGIYTGMLLTGTLWQHLYELDRICHEHLEQIIREMARRECVTEELKASDPMEWVRSMNNIRNRAEEIVLTEFVYN